MCEADKESRIPLEEGPQPVMVAQPGDGAFDFPALSIPLQRSSILSGTTFPTAVAIRTNALDAIQDEAITQRIEGQADQVDQSLGKVRFVGDLECFRPMRCETVVAPDPLHRRFALPDRPGPAAGRPAGTVQRFPWCELGHDFGSFRTADRGSASAARSLLFDPRQPLLGKPASLCADSVTGTAEFGGNIPVLPTVGHSQPRSRSECFRLLPFENSF